MSLKVEGKMQSTKDGQKPRELNRKNNVVGNVHLSHFGGLFLDIQNQELYGLG